MKWLDKWVTRRWIYTKMPPHIYRVINAARRFGHAWTVHDANKQYEATFELLNAIEDLETLYGRDLGPTQRP